MVNILPEVSCYKANLSHPKGFSGCIWLRLFYFENMS
jgi:hypothetical protein